MYSFSELYINLAKKIIDNGQLINNTYELLDVKIKLENINDCLLSTSARSASIKYILAENIWYAAGKNDLQFISKFASKWLEVSDDNLTCNSAYGYIIQKKFGFNQISLIVNELSKNKYSRRACIIINDANDFLNTKDEECTLNIQFVIRNNKLNMFVNMRSNDFIYGLVNDIPAFVILQKYIAYLLNVEEGYYIHNVVSMHVYIKDLYKLFQIATSEVKPSPYYINPIKLYDEAENIYNKVLTDKLDIVQLCKDLDILKEANDENNKI